MLERDNPMHSYNFRHIVVREHNNVLFITLHIPETRNALAPEVVAELTHVTAFAHNNAHTRALVIRGSQGFFCAGGNIGSFQSRLNQSAPQQHANPTEDPVARHNRRFGYFLESFSTLPIPVIAVVEGAAMGGGLGLACCADVVLATKNAKFGLVETTLGIIPAQIAPFVHARIGRRNTLRLGLFGEHVSGTQAQELGIVDELAGDSAGLDALLAQWLTRMSRCAPNANRALKKLISTNNACHPDHLSAQLDHAAHLFSLCMSDEGPEGISAFREKRSSRWSTAFTAEHVQALQAPAPAAAPTQNKTS